MGRSGSSPHARGTQFHFSYSRLWGRFIPACAGNAGTHGSPVLLSTVHPRMRGERFGKLTKYCAGDGSSPHARGTQPEPNLGPPYYRFIPACAGNAGAIPKCFGLNAVHPRMRGERLRGFSGLHNKHGSSPHARGTPGPQQHGPSSSRFIPACAGNALGPVGPKAPCSVHPRMRGERLDHRGLDDGQTGSSPHARGTLPPRWRPG